MTELIPPNYGIVDGNAFFINQVVIGKPPQVSNNVAKHALLYARYLASSLRSFDSMLQIGEKVNCEAVVNTDGGNYQFRCTRVQVAAPMVSFSALISCNSSKDLLQILPTALHTIQCNMQPLLTQQSPLSSSRSVPLSHSLPYTSVCTSHIYTELYRDTMHNSQQSNFICCQGEYMLFCCAACPNAPTSKCWHARFHGGWCKANAPQ